jgi:hypothetical protein
MFAAGRADEIRTLRELLPAVRLCKNRVWLLVVVAKQDLWWPEKADVDRHYREGDFEAEIRTGLDQIDPKSCRREVVFASLVIYNLRTPSGELIRENAAGYDQALQVGSLRRLVETVDALRQWENRS